MATDALLRRKNAYYPPACPVRKTHYRTYDLAARLQARREEEGELLRIYWCTDCGCGYVLTSQVVFDRKGRKRAG